MWSRALADLGSRPAGNVPALDVLRTAAVLLVFCVHLGGHFPHATVIWRLPFVNWGWTGVDLFFVLSGYLIGAQLWKGLLRQGTVNIGRFILRRGLRIWPLYFAFVLKILLTTVLHGGSLSPIASDVFFVSNYFPHYMSGGWSLSIEEQFYVVVPILLFVLCRFVPPSRLWIVPALWLIVLPIIRFYVPDSGPVANSDFAVGIYTRFQTHSDGLAIGLLLAWISVFRPKDLAKPASSVIAIVLTMYAAAFVLRSGISRHLFGFTALALIYGSTAYLVLASARLPRWMEWRAFYVTSRLSYGVYLNHFAVLGVLAPYVARYFGSGALSAIVTGALGWPAALAVAFVTFSTIELPFLELRDKWLRRKPSTRAEISLAPAV